MPLTGFLIRGLSIVLIDLLLAGDNALVIAMAVRKLAPRDRRLGIVCGAVLAVILRVALTALASRVLTLDYIGLVGGLFVLWIALKVMVDASDPPDAAPAPTRLLRTIGFILWADLTMSVDNILAIAGAAHGHIGLIAFGLGLSIPFVVFSSNLLADLMDRYPVTIYLGVAILGKVGGDMVLEDGFVVRAVHPSEAVRFLVDLVLIALLLLAGRRWAAARRKHATA
ncbi:MAG TPA: TerC family protein [Bryobacteraceae bacterium]|nr:TerC family protein [Bryobacteraceae bacterium]